MRAIERLCRVAALAGLAGLAACATKPPRADTAALAEYQAANDPLEPFNRTMYRVNTTLDRYTLRPAAVAYTKVVPEPARDGIHNALGNLTTPVKLSNDIMQGKPQRAGDTLMRFLINSTLGVLGFMDVAKHLGYPDHDTDFGVTLAIWGAGPGPYLFLPVLGPGNPRDSSGRIVDIAGDPFSYIGQGIGVTAARWTRFGLNLVDQRAQFLGTFSDIERTALDPYATFRSLYRQHRDAQIEEIRADNAHTVPAWFPAPAPNRGQTSGASQ